MEFQMHMKLLLKDLTNLQVSLKYTLFIHMLPLPYIHLTKILKLIFYLAPLG